MDEIHGICRRRRHHHQLKIDLSDNPGSEFYVLTIIRDVLGGEPSMVRN